MADGLSSRRAEIEGKNKDAVRALLGEPVLTTYWKNTPPPANASPADLATFKGTTLDEIWVYPSGRVHFALSGTALKVDDRADKHLPQEDPGLFA
jgi:hypothetical protein